MPSGRGAIAQMLGKAFPAPSYADLVRAGNLKDATALLGASPTAQVLQSDINRGVLPGTRTPGADELTPAEAALADRYAWGAQGGIGGLPVAVGYEGLKALSQSGVNVLPKVASALGFEDTGSQFEQDATSSPASIRNILAYLKGATGR